MVIKNTMLVILIFYDVGDAKKGLTNIAIASYVTAFAQLKLFSLVDKIEKQRPYSVLNHDTDTMIYVSKYSDAKIENGDNLGELSDAFEGYSGAKYHKFASLGPEKYGYELVFSDGSTEANIKVKGLTFPEKALDTISLLLKKVISSRKKITAHARNSANKNQCANVANNAHTKIIF